MPEYLVTIITTIGTSTLVATIVVYLAKTVISARVHKAIQFEYDKKIESIRADIRIAESERSVKFTWLHEQSAMTIAKIYELLHNLLSDHNDYIKMLESSEDPPQSERRKIFSKSLHELKEYFYPRQIFIPKSTALRIKELVEACRNSTLDFMTYVEEPIDRISQTKKWVEILDIQKDEIIPLLNELENIFRDHLGVVEPESTESRELVK